MNVRIKTAVDLMINLAVTLSVVWALKGKVRILKNGGVSVSTECLRFFTVQSNILAAVMSLVYVVCDVVWLIRPAQAPDWLRIIKFASATAVFVTFVTVVIFLAPQEALRGGWHGWKGYSRLFRGENFELHFLAPVLSVLVFILFEGNGRINPSFALWGLAPTVLYSVLYLIMVVFVKPGWPDFYGFTFGGHYALVPLSMLGMYTLTYLLTVVIRVLQIK